MALASCYCLHDDHWFLTISLKAVRPFGPAVCFVSKRAWNGSDGNWERVVEITEAAGAEVVLGDWPDESLHRSTALAEMKKRGHRHILIPDGDEVPEKRLLETLAKIAKNDLADLVRVRMDTYWRDAEHVIRPREELAPILLLNCQKSGHVHIREYSGERTLVIGPEYGLLHHLSYAGPDERVERKISTWGHRQEVGLDWYQRSWKGWEADPLLRDLHPTHPHAYGWVERIPAPHILADVPLWREMSVEAPTNWPSVSVVIPLHGGPEDIRQCLDSLAKVQDLVHETVVVDDASPDDAANVAAGYEFVTLLKNEENLGFAKTCNEGYRATTGSIVLFLNSDTVVPRAGLIRLIETLMSGGTVAAAGPLSNEVGYYQRVEPTYTCLDNLDPFAEDLALSEREDRDVEMLVGFALALRRSVLEEVGLFDERFGRGMFEDTDLCYRIARAGYRLRLANRAYIHHWGSRTLGRTELDVPALLHRNGEAYKAKWKRDLETGYASRLPGFDVSGDLVVFNPSRHPDKLARDIARLRDRARISLCMIVRNEERVIGACLESAKPFFGEIIVVDTGSTDRTKEIAREHGVIIREMIWPDSFAEARNESIRGAKGDWIFWLDADDTLPFTCGELILQAAIHSPREVSGYIVPVQFVEDGPGAGTRVDHVKLFRNKPGVQFVGRIHEQILASLTPHGEIASIDAHVLHSGYDTSPEGQKKKRERDWPLLWLDYEERPEHPFPRFNIGMTYHFTDEHENAIEWLQKSIEASGPNDSHLRKAWSMKGVSLRTLGRLEEAEAAFREGADAVGDDPELEFQLAMTLSAQGRLPEAMAVYEAMPTSTAGHFSSVDVGILTFKRLHNLGAVKHALGDYLGAKADWLEAHRLNPGFLHSIEALCEAALGAGDYRTAREACETLLRAAGPTEGWAGFRARLADDCGEPGGSIECLSRITRELPHAIGPRLVLARALLQHGHVNGAVPHLMILDRQNVAEAAFFLGIASLNVGDVASALRHTERALQLNPTHEQSQRQLASLQAMSLEELPSVLSKAEQKRLLRGSHVGKLGPASRRFSVVIVTFNSAAYLPPCLESVLPQLKPEDEVILVDNASSDGTLDLAHAIDDPRLTVIANKSNVGYSKAANQGLLKASGRILVLLNPDTEVSAGWLDRMAAHLADGVGAIGPVSDAVAGQQFVGHHVRPGAAPDAAALAKVVAREFRGRDFVTKMLVGMCLMVPREVFDKFGLLDEAMVLGADDLEFSWRMRALGLKLVVALDVFVHHAGQASFAQRPRKEVSKLIARSDAALLRKLKSYYGPDVPSSMSLWGCPIFDEAFSRGQ